LKLKAKIWIREG